MDWLFWITLYLLIGAIVRIIGYNDAFDRIRSGEMHKDAIAPRIGQVVGILATAYLFWTVGLHP